MSHFQPGRQEKRRGTWIPTARAEFLEQRLLLTANTEAVFIDNVAADAGILTIPVVAGSAINFNGSPLSGTGSGSGYGGSASGASTLVGESTAGSGTGFGAANSPSSMAPEIVVTGNNVNITDGDATPDLADHTDFGTAPFNTTIFRTFTVKNEGTATLNLGPLAFATTMYSGFKFSTTDTLVTTLAPNESDTFVIEFSSLTAGIWDGTVYITSDDADENPFEFRIRAEGIGSAPEIAVTGINDLLIPDNDTTPIP